MGTKERKHTVPLRYDEAFKAGAVRMVTEQGMPSREVAAELGVCVSTRYAAGSRQRERRRSGRRIVRTTMPSACPI